MKKVLGSNLQVKWQYVLGQLDPFARWTVIVDFRLQGLKQVDDKRNLYDNITQESFARNMLGWRKG